MKKSLILITIAAFMFLFSCKKDEETSPFDAAFTTETPAQSKAKVEQNSIDLVDQLDNLTSATAIEVLMNLNNLESGTPLKSTAASPVLEPLSFITSLNDKNNISKVFEGMKTMEALVANDPIKFSAIFDSIAGKYTYNFQTGEFDETELLDKVIIEFPGKETDITNTATITVDNFSVAEITDPMDEYPSGLDNELPSSISIDLKYNAVSIAGVKLNASYKSDGMPTKVVIEIYLDDFTFTTTAVHSPYSSASWKNTLKLNSDILFETYIAASGNWSDENISDNIIDTEFGSDIHIEEIIKNANAHVILMNLEVAGQVNTKVLGDAIWSLDDNRDNMTEEEYVQGEVDAINANAQLVVIYRDSNTKIAEAEAYVYSYEDDYEDTHYELAMRFVYADGSEVDVETYVNGFYSSMNDFIDILNSEYDLNIDHIGVKS